MSAGAEGLARILRSVGEKGPENVWSSEVRHFTAVPPLLTDLEMLMEAGAACVYGLWVSCPGLCVQGPLPAQWPPGLGTSVCMARG